MATRNIVLSVGGFYHVYNRGVDKRVTFKDTVDHNRFIDLLYLCNSKQPINVRDLRKSHKNIFDFDRNDKLVSIGAYCLMPNHFHILATPNEEGALAVFMAKLATSYTMYFNKRYERTGSLFQGTYKAKHADTDEYLKYLFSYIHLNPAKLFHTKQKGQMDTRKAFQEVATYKYSSLPDYIYGNRLEGVILEPNAFPEYFADNKDIEKELFDWLSFGLEEQLISP